MKTESAVAATPTNPPRAQAWQSLSEVAKEFNRTRQTIHNWCVTGFILSIGYKARRTVKGQWELLPPQ